MAAPWPPESVAIATGVGTAGDVACTSTQESPRTRPHVESTACRTTPPTAIQRWSNLAPRRRWTSMRRARPRSRSSRRCSQRSPSADRSWPSLARSRASSAWSSRASAAQPGGARLAPWPPGLRARAARRSRSLPSAPRSRSSWLAWRSRAAASAGGPSAGSIARRDLCRSDLGDMRPPSMPAESTAGHGPQGVHRTCRRQARGAC